jgi:DNA-binding transcriptional LysR family regulator
MDIRLLAYFVAVYEERNFSLAARRCAVSQPSISAAIKQMEEQLECLLFSRNARGVTPTPAGDLIFQTAVRLLAEFGSLKSVLRRSVATQRIRCGVSPDICCERVAVLLKEAATASPELYFELQGENRGADITIVPEGGLAEDEVFHPLWRDSYRAVMPLGHLLTMREEVTLASLADSPLIVAGGVKAPGSIHQAFRERGPRPDRVSVVHSHADAITMASAGLGIAVVPHSEPLRSGLVMREIEDLNLERNVGLSCSRSYQLPPGLSMAVKICSLRWHVR